MNKSNMSKILSNNVAKRIEETKKYSTASQIPTLTTFLIELQNRIVEKIHPLIVGVTSEPVFEYNGKTCEVKTRKLPARIECVDDSFEDFSTMINGEYILEQISTEIADEFKAEYEYGNLNDFHPMILADSGGIVFDLTNFNPVISFLTRYYAAPKKETT